MTLTASLHERMAAQVAERRETGRQLRRGDLIELPDGRVVPLVDAGSAGECIEALTARAIRNIKKER